MNSDDFAPVPGSEATFSCGYGGCSVEYNAPGVRLVVDARRREWATAYRMEHGEFPNMRMQLDFVERVMEEEEQAARRREIMRAHRSQGERRG